MKKVTHRINKYSFWTLPGIRDIQRTWPNPFGIYNQSGNVAEMVLEKGIAAGGSYNDPGYDVRIVSVKHYDDASAEIGFRVAMYIQQ